jgi:hypothetical protein
MLLGVEMPLIVMCQHFSRHRLSWIFKVCS